MSKLDDIFKRNAIYSKRAKIQVKELMHEIVGHWYEENDPGGEAGKWELDLHREIDQL